MKNIISFNEAREQILARANVPRDVVSVPLSSAQGRVLAANVTAEVNLPPMDNSAMDGYACRIDDLFLMNSSGLPISQRIAAGDPEQDLYPGTIARIFTGAPLPRGADTVIMQEDATVLPNGRIHFNKKPVLGAHIRRAGEELRIGDPVLKAGIRLNAAHLGIAAAAGLAQLPVVQRLKVALLLTGNELNEPGTPLPPGGIYNSNRYTLTALLNTLGVDVDDLGIVEDTFEATRFALRRAAQHHDVIISTGGVSVGEEDHVKVALAAEGQLDLWKIAMKPGKPLAFGQIERARGDAAFFIGLPGNPVSAVVTFLMLVRPFLRRLQGESLAEIDVPWSIQLPVAVDMPADKRLEFLRVRVSKQGTLQPFKQQSSSLLTSLTECHGLAVKPPDTTITAGDYLGFIPFYALGL